MAYATMIGREEGLEKGLAEGRAKGIAEGRAEGLQKEVMLSLLKLLSA